MNSQLPLVKVETESYIITHIHPKILVL